MRIVGGQHRGREIFSPRGHHVRPTTDRTREALFDVLGHARVPLPEGAVVLDVFAGTGALGLEAFSRGAAHVLFIENHRDSLKFLKRNVSVLDAGERTAVLRRDALHPGTPPASPGPAALAFLDPPYGEGLAAPALTALAAHGWFADGAVAVVELTAREDFTAPEGMTMTDERAYGETRLLFLEVRVLPGT